MSVLAPEVFADLSSLIPSFGVIVMGFFHVVVLCVIRVITAKGNTFMIVSHIVYLYYIFCGHYVLL